MIHHSLVRYLANKNTGLCPPITELMQVDAYKTFGADSDLYLAENIRNREFLIEVETVHLAAYGQESCQESEKQHVKNSTSL